VQRSTAETSIARQRLARHVSAATNKHIIIEELLEVVDFYSLHPEVTKGGHVRTLKQVRSCKRTETGEREWSESSAVD
jgi:hypothetical protein